MAISLLYLAHLERESGNLAAGVSALERALALNPGDTTTLSLLGAYLTQAGRAGEAVDRLSVHARRPDAGRGGAASLALALGPAWAAGRRRSRHSPGARGRTRRTPWLLVDLGTVRLDGGRGRARAGGVRGGPRPEPRRRAAHAACSGSSTHRQAASPGRRRSSTGGRPSPSTPASARPCSRSRRRLRRRRRGRPRRARTSSCSSRPRRSTPCTAGVERARRGSRGRAAWLTADAGGLRDRIDRTVPDRGELTPENALSVATSPSRLTAGVASRRLAAAADPDPAGRRSCPGDRGGRGPSCSRARPRAPRATTATRSWRAGSCSGPLATIDGRTARGPRRLPRRLRRPPCENRLALQALGARAPAAGRGGPGGGDVLTRLLGKNPTDLGQTRQLLAQAPRRGRASPGSGRAGARGGARGSARGPGARPSTLAGGYLRLERDGARPSGSSRRSPPGPARARRPTCSSGARTATSAEYERARAELRAALNLDPRVRRAHYYLGMVYLTGEGVSQPR